MEGDPRRFAEIGKIADIIRDIGIAMVTTASPDGSLRSRPLVTPREEFAGTVAFLVSASGALAEDVRRSPAVGVAYSDPDQDRYVSLSGRGRILRDPARIARLWHTMLVRWFPKGQEDPDLALLEVDAEVADAWDSRRGVMVRVYERLRAVTSGEMPRRTDRDHAGSPAARRASRRSCV